MAQSPYKYVHNPIWDYLQNYARLLSTDAPKSNTEARRDSRNLIRRLEHIVSVQEDRVKKMQHRSAGSVSKTLRLRASMKDVLATYRRTLQQIRENAKTLELSWALHTEL